MENIYDYPVSEHKKKFEESLNELSGAIRLTPKI